MDGMAGWGEFLTQRNLNRNGRHSSCCQWKGNPEGDIIYFCILFVHFHSERLLRKNAITAPCEPRIALSQPEIMDVTLLNYTEMVWQLMRWSSRRRQETDGPKWGRGNVLVALLDPFYPFACFSISFNMLIPKKKIPLQPEWKYWGGRHTVFSSNFLLLPHLKFWGFFVSECWNAHLCRSMALKMSKKEIRARWKKARLLFIISIIHRMGSFWICFQF